MDLGSITESSAGIEDTSAAIEVPEELGSKILGVDAEGTRFEEVAVATVRAVVATATAVCVRASRRRSSTQTTVTHPRRRMSWSADFGSMEDSKSEGSAVSVRLAKKEKGSKERGMDNIRSDQIRQVECS